MKQAVEENGRKKSARIPCTYCEGKGKIKVNGKEKVCTWCNGTGMIWLEDPWDEDFEGRN